MWWYIIKISFILLVEWNIYYCLGYAMGKIKCFPKAATFSGTCIYGFLGYHVLFWCIAFPCTLLNSSLTVLTIIWVVIITVLMIAIISFCRIKILKQYKKVLCSLIQYGRYMIPYILMICFLLYFVCVNSQCDIDARTYIGEVTTKLDSNQLAGISVRTGAMTNILPWKRAVSMFGANSAVLCKLFQIRPLVFCRTVREMTNILLLSLASFEFYLWVYREKRHRYEYAAMAAMLSESFLFLFGTIFSPSAFILYRTYEGKAYCAGTLILLLINLVIRLCEKHDIRFFILIFMSMLTGISISPSSSFLMPVLAGCMILAYVLYSHRWSYLLAYIAASSLNLGYIILYALGFEGFQIR